MLACHRQVFTSSDLEILPGRTPVLKLEVRFQTCSKELNDCQKNCETVWPQSAEHIEINMTESYERSNTFRQGQSERHDFSNSLSAEALPLTNKIVWC